MLYTVESARIESRPRKASRSGSIVCGSSEMLSTNVFKKIIDREIPTTFLHEDDRCLAFADIHPQAPVHIVIISRREIRTHDDLTEADAAIVGHMHIVAVELAERFGLKNGYRLTINCREDGGQTVPHLHMHLMGGRPFGWPPG